MNHDPCCNPPCAVCVLARGAQASWHSLVVFFIPLYALYNPGTSGGDEGIWSIGTAMYTSMIVVVNLRVGAAAACRRAKKPAHAIMAACTDGPL